MQLITYHINFKILWTCVFIAVISLCHRSLCQTPTDKPEPVPQAASQGVQGLLKEMEEASRKQEWKGMLRLSAKALAQAQVSNDAVGIAQALRGQALAQEGLGKIEAALVSWRTCASAWETAGDGVERTEALGYSSLLHYTHKEIETGKQELDTLLVITDGKRPVSLAATFHKLGRRFFSYSLLPQAQRLFEKALTIRQQLVPDSVDLANSLFNLARVVRRRGDLKAAEEYHQKALIIYQKLAPDSADVADSLNNLGVLAYDRDDMKAAEEYYQESLAIRQKLAPDSMDVADCLNNLGNASYARGDLKVAEEYHQKALIIYQKLAPGSADLANCLNNLGIVARRRRDMKAEEEYRQKALIIYQKLAPDSTDVTDSLFNLARIARARRDLKVAEEYYQKALIIYQKLAPDSADVADSLNNLGVLAYDRDDMKAAEEYYQKALAIRQKLDADSMDVADSLNNLGVLARARGDLKVAEEYYQKALIIYQKLDAESTHVADSLNNLGVLESDRGDLKVAEEYYQESLAIRQKLAPDSADVADSLNNLGVLAYDRDDMKAAEEYYQESLAIRQKLAPDSMDVADCLNNLGNASYARGDLKVAEEYHQKALIIYQKLAPGSADLAQSLNNFGVMARGHGDLKAAEEYHQQALAIYQKLAPDSLEVANIFYCLSRIYLKRNEPLRALSLLQQAADILQKQRNDIQDPETRTLFFEKNIYVFAMLAHIYLQVQQPGKAIEILESARARTLIDQRVERFLLSQDTTPDDVPKLLLLQKQQLDNQRRITLNERQHLDVKQQPKLFKQNTLQLERLAAKQRKIEADVHRRSPRYAKLVYPKPLTLAQMQHGLEEGTLVLLYAVGENECDLYTVTHTSKNHYSVPIAAKELAELKRKFRNSLSDPNDLEDEYKQYARQLYSLLIAPAQAEINNAHTQRLLICPDSSLYEVPFAALMHPKEPGDPKSRFLLEDKPLGQTMSLGVYLEGKQEAQVRRQQPSPPGVVPLYALGDAPNVPKPTPKPGKETAAAELPERERFVRLGGKNLDPVPQTGVLAQHLGALYGKESLVRVGKEATKQSVLTESVKASVLNLSCHGLLDNGDPLASCLALTPNAADGGLLYAYEILGMHLPGSHVVLGACETGLGGERGQSQSEGVVGLTRAFLYAGAENVVVSLWSVEVNSTVALLEDLHKELHAGKGMSEALRDAQLRMLHGEGEGTAEQRKTWQRPSFWAPFLNYGLLE